MRALSLSLMALAIACRQSATAEHEPPVLTRTVSDSQSMDSLQRVLYAYETKRISADAAAKALLSLGPWSVELDRPLREAIVRELQARGKLPRDFRLPPDSP